MKKFVPILFLSICFATMPEATAQLWHKGGGGIGINVGYEFSPQGGILVGIHTGYFDRVEGAIVGGLVEATFYLENGKEDVSFAGEFRTVRASEPQSYGGRLGIVFGDGPGMGWRITAFLGTASAIYTNISFLPYRSSGIHLGAFARATEDGSGLLPIR